ncbi:MBOAT family O-acyltransferase [Oleiharenicola lentus]|uniref:MBOAT family O-acyltransferase n=1 Tax=Oleiharenicola lentus TaxID=2508720 RepID=UPI003F680879
MLFKSHLFIFGFLPVVWAGWILLNRKFGPRAGAAWLTIGSVVFYAWWDWRFVPVLLVSLGVNFLLARQLMAHRKRGWLVIGLVWNLGLLGFFKYWNFFAATANTLGGSFQILQLALPLGISFFTFQKIAFLVDASRGQIKSLKFSEFALFVFFFPQLIAGPIVHHRDFIPQLHAKNFGRFDARQIALGLTVFAAGLFQKSFVADTIAPIADAAFGHVANGTMLRFQEAWLGLIAYSVQLFYDFSGYSHMALGLALLFGLKLPVNFLAPYTSGSIAEFWRRWHITLSAFLRDYVYIPLGGSRVSPPRHLTNLFLTMLIGGIWHGAGWTFVVWGAWHGLALAVNHAWKRNTPGENATRWGHLLTLLTVFIGWVFFRAPDLSSAWHYCQSLFGWHGISVPIGWMSVVEPLAPVVRARGLWPNIPVGPFALLVLAGAFLCCFRGPRLLQWCGLSRDDVSSANEWQSRELNAPNQSLGWTRALLAGAMFALAAAWLSRAAPFLYFQF